MMKKDYFFVWSLTFFSLKCATLTYFLMKKYFFICSLTSSLLTCTMLTYFLMKKEYLIIWSLSSLRLDYYFNFDFQEKSIMYMYLKCATLTSFLMKKDKFLTHRNFFTFKSAMLDLISVVYLRVFSRYSGTKLYFSFIFKDIKICFSNYNFKKKTKIMI